MEKEDKQQFQYLNTCHYNQSLVINSMIKIILAVFALLWLGLGTWCYTFLKKRIQGPFKRILKVDSSIKDQYKPFERTDFSQWQLSTIYRNCFLVFPLKFTLLLYWTITAVVLIYTIIAIQKITKRQYIAWLRNLFKLYMNVFVGTSLYLICQVSERDVNKKTQQNPIIISNHISWWEIFYFVTTRWPIAFLAKQDVKNWPLIGTIAKFGGSIFIQRQNTAARQSTMNLIKQRSLKIKEGHSTRYPPLLIFPEGTTTNGKYILNFKKGAFEYLQPIQISILNYECPGWNVSLDIMGQLANILLFLCHSPRLQILNIYNVNPQNQNVEQYMQDCQRIMSKTGLQRQVSSAGFRHKKQYQSLLNDKLKSN